MSNYQAVCARVSVCVCVASRGVQPCFCTDNMTCYMVDISVYSCEFHYFDLFPVHRVTIRLLRPFSRFFIFI